jgi:hypothetical protein
VLDRGLCERPRYVSAQSAGRSCLRDAYSPFVARQLRGAARAEIAFSRARSEKPVDVDASTVQQWETVDNLIRSQGTASHKHPALGALYRARYGRGISTRTLIEDLHGKHYLLARDIVPFLMLLSLETGLEIECCKGLTVDCLRKPGGETVEICI